MPVTFSADGPVGTITLDNPPANSYDIEFMLDLADAVGAADGRAGGSPAVATTTSAAAVAEATMSNAPKARTSVLRARSRQRSRYRSAARWR